ncbi:MAG: hypothetical protein AB7L13_17750 [Acidimicrobiia bacterium]
MGRDWKSYDAGPLSLWERVKRLEDERNELSAELRRTANELVARGFDAGFEDDAAIIVLPGAARSLAADVGEMEANVEVLRLRVADLAARLTEARDAVYNVDGQPSTWLEF